jgi:hypothetical protein
MIKLSHSCLNLDQVFRVRLQERLVDEAAEALGGLVDASEVLAFFEMVDGLEEVGAGELEIVSMQATERVVSQTESPAVIVDGIVFFGPFKSLGFLRCGYLVVEESC